MTIFSSGEKKYVLPDKESRIFELKLQLPQDLTCEQCILQWTYVTGNRYAKLLVQHFNTRWQLYTIQLNLAFSTNKWLL